MSELDKKLMRTIDLNNERLEKLKNLFPDLFTQEGKLNPDELNKLVDPDLVKEAERFEFKWFGKSEAKRNAFTPSRATLVYDEARSVNPEFADGNMIIEGENLETLKCLLAGYRERVKCIYIDPPYNTGNDFVYSDRWDETRENYWEHIGVAKDGVKMDTNAESSGRYHSNWLNMMYSRLLLARQLLREDGVIFISIDDNEVHHLRKLCDEVFGEQNFIEKIIWKKRSTPPNDQVIGAAHEYIVIYCKNTDEVKLNLKKRNGEQIERYQNPDNHPRGPWTSGDLMANIKGGRYVKSLYFPIVNPNTGQEHYPSSNGNWRFNKEKIEMLLKNNEIFFGDNEKGRPKLKRFLCDVKEGITYSTLWDFVPLNTKGSQEMTDILGNLSIFDNPKPSGLIKEIYKLGVNDKDIILDFFSGSGTTAHAVIELNREDNGNRKFILVQLPELTGENTEAYKAGYKKISDITIERNRRVIQKIEKEESAKHPSLLDADINPFKTGFKVYRLAKSSFPRVDFAPNPLNTEEENLALLDKYIDEKEAVFFAMINENNIFDEVLLKNGFMLNYTKIKVDEFSKNSVFQIKDDFKECLICMELSIAKETLKALEPFKDNIFICLERALDTTMKWNLKHLLGDKLIAY